MADIRTLFDAALIRLRGLGFADSDIEWCENIIPPTDADIFAREVIFVICNSGMKNTVTGAGYHGGTFDKRAGTCFHTPAVDGRCSCRVNGPSPAQCAYADLWDRINGPGAWDANPWVTVTEFRRVVDVA